VEKRWAEAITDIIGDGRAAQLRFRVKGESMAPTLQPGDEVFVEAASLDALRPGDLVLVQEEGRSLLHRFLGVRCQGEQRMVLTGGDRLWRADPLCPEEALKGRAVAILRGGRPLSLPAGRWWAWRHRLRTALWVIVQRLRLLLPVSLLLASLAVGTEIGQAAVTLVSFEVEWVGDQVRLTWETASEVDNIGFYVVRREGEAGDFERVTDLIPSEGDIIGGFYEWIDGDIVPGTVYYYLLEDVSATGFSGYAGPVSTAPEATATFTPTATFTSTPTPTPTASPTATSTPSPTATVTPSSTPSMTITPSPSATSTMTPKPSSAATATSQPSATPSATPLRPTATQTATPEPSFTPTSTSVTASPPTMTVATATMPPQPSLAPPTATTVALVVEPPAETDPSTEKTVSEEELTRAKRRLTWSLIGIGGAIGGTLLLIILALIVFALYHWGFLRHG
jgi:hypothetical protein